MRKPRPFRWIEEAEARQAVTIALSEAPVAAPYPTHPNHWTSRIRRWAFAKPTDPVVEDDPADPNI